MNFYKSIVNNLNKYLLNGEINNNTVPQYINGKFPCNKINNKSFQFIKKQEDIDVVNLNTTIPVLIITTPDIYMEGKVIYQDKFVDLKTMILTELRTAKKINFFIIPQIINVIGSYINDITYYVNIDYVKEYDPYNFIADELNQLIRKLYFKETCGDYYYYEEEYRKFQFVPKTTLNINTPGAIISRIRQDFIIKSCNFN